MGDWDDERGWRTSVLGRVDWACWLAVVGLLFVTVMSVVVQFVAMGIVTAIVAILLVVFDSWVNRPTGRRAMSRYEESQQYGGTGWSEVRRVESRPQQPVRMPPGQQQRQGNARQPQNFQGRPNQGQQQRPQQGQPGRQFPGQQPQMRPNQGGQPRPNQGGQQPTRVNQGQQQQPPFRPGGNPSRREPDYRART